MIFLKVKVPTLYAFLIKAGRLNECEKDGKLVLLIILCLLLRIVVTMIPVIVFCCPAGFVHLRAVLSYKNFQLSEFPSCVILRGRIKSFLVWFVGFFFSPLTASDPKLNLSCSTEKLKTWRQKIVVFE